MPSHSPTASVTVESWTLRAAWPRRSGRRTGWSSPWIKTKDDRVREVIELIWETIKPVPNEFDATTGGKVAEDPAKGLFHRGTVSVEHLYSEADVAQQAKPFVVHVAFDGWPPEWAWRRLHVEPRLRWSEVLRRCGVAEDACRPYGDGRGDWAPSLRRTSFLFTRVNVSSHHWFRLRPGRVPVVDLPVSCSAVLTAVVGDLTFTPLLPEVAVGTLGATHVSSGGIPSRERPAQRASRDSASLPLPLLDASPPLSGPSRTAHCFWRCCC